MHNIHNKKQCHGSHGTEATGNTKARGFSVTIFSEDELHNFIEILDEYIGNVTYTLKMHAISRLLNISCPMLILKRAEVPLNKIEITVPKKMILWRQALYLNRVRG